ncbi:MAG: chemotaxis protein CheB [Planctomycetales bacterium]|nr:chemotaxis protein CheB [Planctomycetales bacterium]
MAKQNKATRTTPLTPATVTVPPGASGTDAALFPVVGIGASAGGLEALTEFFRTMASRSGMAFVVVTHLDPDHKSAMAEILSHVTTMVVGEVRDGTELQADHVYVIPPNANMVVERNRLRLVPRRATLGLNLPVDVFLQSLAVARNSQAVGVILSGTGTDGTLGLKAIKGQGGITFVQDDTAEHDGMPRSAFKAGCVDLVMSPRLIATELSRLGSHPSLSGGLQTASAGSDPISRRALAPGSSETSAKEQSEPEPDASAFRLMAATDDADFNTIVRLLTAAVGVDFTHYKPPTL